MSHSRQDRILLTGATGYVGRRLLPALTAAGYSVRCLAREAARFEADPHPEVDLLEGDLLDEALVARALEGIDVAYFLVHSMGAGGDFEEKDLSIARVFSSHAAQAEVKRIIYLGGLGRGPQLSPHLASRQKVGEILRESSVPTLEFRASIIIGAGSISFEMIRALVDRLPIMVAPRWVRTLAQPIAIDDVIAYLLAGLKIELDGSAVVEIGGPDRLSYLDLLREYAQLRGLRRIILPVPVLTPWLSSLWLNLVTPLQAPIGRWLIEGVRNESVVDDPAALTIFPIRPRGLRQAIHQTLQNEGKERR